LCEFETVSEIFRNTFDVIEVLVHTEPNKPIAIKDKKLQIFISLSDLENDNFKGVHNEIEELMKLRPVKEGNIIFASTQIIDQFLF
jgi:hypothetical protein